MKRTLVFLLLGPTLVVISWLMFLAAIGGLRGSVDFDAAALFVFAFFVAAIMSPIDGYLARSLPIHLRAPLIVVAVAAIVLGIPIILVAISPFALFSILSSMSPQLFMALLAIGGCMGVCSLFSHNHRVKVANPASARGSLS